jgi:hypothetical protein
MKLSTAEDLAEGPVSIASLVLGSKYLPAMELIISYWDQSFSCYGINSFILGYCFAG